MSGWANSTSPTQTSLNVPDILTNSSTLKGKDPIWLTFVKPVTQAKQQFKCFEEALIKLLILTKGWLCCKNNNYD